MVPLRYLKNVFLGSGRAEVWLVHLEYCIATYVAPQMVTLSMGLTYCGAPEQRVMVVTLSSTLTYCGAPERSNSYVLWCP